MQVTVSRDDQTVTVPVLSTFAQIVGTKALTVPEILGTILDYPTPPTLASAARVSKAWSAIALDKLWSDYDVKVVHLLQILPLYLTGSPYYNWRLLRTPTSEEWNRFYSYALRIRSLSIPRPEHGFDRRITAWKIENGVLFPRLRRIEWSFSQTVELPCSHLHSFVTPDLQEFCLKRDYRDEGVEEEGPSFLEDFAIIEGLRLKKFKLEYSSRAADSKLESAIAKVIASNADSIQALEFSSSNLKTLSIVGHSLRSLKALNFCVQNINEAASIQPIKALVEGCPHVTYLRLGTRPAHSYVNFLDLPDVLAILGWHLLSFEVRLARGVNVSKAQLGQMAAAWPKLKKLDFNWQKKTAYTNFPLSHLADIVAEFPELEELGALFDYNTNDSEGPLLPTYEPSSAPCHPSRLQKLRLGWSCLPRYQRNRDSMAQFLARVCPPGLRIERTSLEGTTNDPVRLAEREKITMTGRDVDPEWDALFQKIEELQGGVRIWVGRIPEVSDGVWF